MTRRTSLSSIALGLCAGLASELGSIEGNRSTIQLLKMGANVARNGNPLPKLTVVDRAHAEAIVASSLARAGDTEIVIDYDHQTVVALDKAAQAPAAGWVKRLFADDNGVFAEVEWTDAAAAKIAGREYRYISPFYTYRSDGRVTAIINAGLTNTPNFDLSEVQLAAAASALGLELTEEEEPDMTKFVAIATALGLAAVADEAAILAAIATQKSKADAFDATATALGVTLGDDLAAVATAAASLKAAAGTGEPDPAKYVPVETVNELRTGLASANQRLDALAAERRKAMIDAASNDGRLPPSLRKHAEKIEDEQALASFIGDLPANGLGKPAVPGAQPAGGKVSELTDEQRAVATALGITPEDMLAKLNEETV